MTSKDITVSECAPTYYESDQWDLLQHPFYSNEACLNKIKQRHRGSVICFDCFGNTPLKSEIKDFLAYHIDIKQSSIMTILNIHGRLKNFARYVNSQSNPLLSILDTPISETIIKYSTWRVENGYVTKTTTAQIKADMAFIRSECLSPSVCLIRNLYAYINHQQNLNAFNFGNDIWDIESLPFQFNTNCLQSCHTLRFDRIRQPFFKQIVKTYIFYRLRNILYKTCANKLVAFNLFSEFLTIHCPNIQSLDELKRIDIEKYIEYTGTLGLKSSTRRVRIKDLEQFWAESSVLGIEGAPTKTLFFASDKIKIPTYQPHTFSDAELARINAHIGELPIQTARLLFILENTGLRISEACSLEEHCVSEVTKGNYQLTYYMYKTKRTHTIPISELVAATIMAAMDKSKSEFDEDCKYVFAREKDKPFRSATFAYHLNTMSYRQNLKDDVGQPLHIQAHSFRRTVATHYANLNIGPNVICLMLGQKRIGCLKHYITIHSSTMIQYLQEITEEDNRMIANIGHIEDVHNDTLQNELLTPLSIGYCAHPVSAGKCPHANSCYTCRMFRPTKAHLSLYERQLYEAETNMTFAKINGFDRIYEINMDLRNNLLQIITAIKGSDTSG